MEEQSSAIPVASTSSSRRTRANRLLIVGIAIMGLASIAVLVLIVTSLLTPDSSRPLQSVSQRDALVAVAQAKANPRNIGAQIAAASTSVLAEDYEQAMYYANRAVQLNTKSVDAKMVKARALQASGDLKQARTLLQDIQKTEEKSSALYANASLLMAVIDEAEGKLESAIEGLKVVQAAEPTNTDVILQLAGLQERIGKKDDAAASYGEALQYIPDLEPALTALRALKSGPADYQLAQAAWQVGNKDEASRLMEQAAKESPELAWLQAALGEFRLMIGEKDGARNAFQAALALDSANEEAKAGLEALQ